MALRANRNLTISGEIFTDELNAFLAQRLIINRTKITPHELYQIDTSSANDKALRNDSLP